MAKLLGIRIRNYRALRDVSIGRVRPSDKTPELPALLCLIGPNGSGKSTLLDAFGFLADCLREGVEAACDKTDRGGFRRLRTQGATGPISFELCYRDTHEDRPLTYALTIGENDAGVPVVLTEECRQARRGTRKVGTLKVFLQLKGGSGFAWAGDSTQDAEGTERVDVDLDDPGRLAITTLGQLKEHPRILRFREYLEGWYLSYFVPEAARSLPAAGAQKHLNRTGDNLANVVEYMERRHPDRFKRVLAEISARIPGIRSIKTQRSADGRQLLQFNESGYKDPFYQRNMSDGTLKMFTYLLLLHDPEPRPFIGIEEPENGLYHKLLERLAEEFKGHAEEHGQNVVVTTHSPYLVDALRPEQVFLVQRGEDGYTQVQRTADLPRISDLIEQGIPLGSLWYSNHFGEQIRP